MKGHEDRSLVDELRRLGEQGIEQALAGEWEDARDSFRSAALICQGADWLEHQASAAG